MTGTTAAAVAAAFELDDEADGETTGTADEMDGTAGCGFGGVTAVVDCCCCCWLGAG